MRNPPKSQECNNKRGLKPDASGITRMLTVIILVLAGSYVALAQEQTPTPAPTPTPSAAETRLTEENKILELEKKNAELKKGIREAQPQPSATPLEGKTTLDDNVVLEVQMVSYEAMSDVSDSIAQEVRKKFPHKSITIGIFNPQEVADWSKYRQARPVLELRVEGLKNRYVALLKKYDDAGKSDSSKRLSDLLKSSGQNELLGMMEVTTGLEGAGNALRGIADVLAIFRTDTEIKGKTVSPDESALVAEIFRALRAKFGDDIKLYYPQVFTPNSLVGDCGTPAVDGSNGGAQKFCSPTLQLISELYGQREAADIKLLDMHKVQAGIEKSNEQKAQAEKRIKEINAEAEKLQAQLKKATKPKQKKGIRLKLKQLAKDKTEAEAAKAQAELQLTVLGERKFYLEQLQALNEQCDKFIADLTKDDEKTGRSQLALFLKGENLAEAFKDSDSYLLEIKSVAAGGNNRTRKNLLRYFTGAKVDHSGGIIVEWELFDKSALSIEGGKVQLYAGYKTPKEIAAPKTNDQRSKSQVKSTKDIAKKQ